MSLRERQQQLITKFSVIEDPQERLAAIVSRAKKWPGPDDEERIDAHLVRGCMSKVWLVGRLEESRCRFRMDADSPLVKGVVALLCELYDNAPPEEVLSVEPELLEALAISAQLSPTRLNGLANVRGTFREIASRFLALQPAGEHPAPLTG